MELFTLLFCNCSISICLIFVEGLDDSYFILQRRHFRGRTRGLVFCNCSISICTFAGLVDWDYFAKAAFSWKDSRTRGNAYYFAMGLWKALLQWDYFAHLLLTWTNWRASNSYGIIYGRLQGAVLFWDYYYLIF